MSDEVATFNVKNTSLRLVHIGGVQVPPGHVVPLIDDEKGINRANVEDSEYLEETDEEATEAGITDVEVKPKAAAKKQAAKTNTQSGAGWTAPKK